MPGHGESMIDFEKNSYTVVKGLIEPEWCKTLYNYVGYSADRCGLKQKHDEEKYREAWDGTFQDKQCPGNYAHYGDPMMDSMMMAHGKKIEEATGMKLAPSYTYYRMYLNGAILKRHKDRPSCEISAQYVWTGTILIVKKESLGAFGLRIMKEKRQLI